MRTITMTMMLAALAALGALAGPAGAASAETGEQRWLVLTRPGEPSRVVATGAVDAVGTVVDTFTLNPDGTFDNLATQVFPDGTLSYHGAGTFAFELDPARCVGVGDVVGPFEITGGTGEYAGASGGGVAELTVVMYFDQTGPGCAEQPARTYVLAHATGTLTLP